MYKLWQNRGVILLAVFGVWAYLHFFHKHEPVVEPVVQQEQETCHFREDAKTIYGHSLDMEVCQKGDNVITETYYVKGEKALEFVYTMTNGVLSVSIWENGKLMRKLRENPVKKI